MKQSSLHAQIRDRGTVSPLLLVELDEWLRAHGMAYQLAERGEYGVSWDQLLNLFVCEEPDRWAETYLVEPDTGDPYRFWDYQRASVRSWEQDVVHEDAAEVGKTREMIVLLAWSAITAMGGQFVASSLVTAPQQTHLNDIIDAIEMQVGADERYGESYLKAFWEKPRKTPHVQLRFRAPNPKHPERPALAVIEFRPAGVDGEALRGVHVNGFGILEEAAKLKDKRHWSEFARALKPGCRQRAYSVPDGDRSTEFYRICASATEDLPVGTPGWRKFHWPKTLMPAPFWSAERDAEMVRRYGGRDTPGYQRNVLGLWGDAESPVFRYTDVEPNVVDVPDFRVLEFVWNPTQRSLDVTIKRLELIKGEHGRKAGRECELESAALELAPFAERDDERLDAWRDLLRAWIEPSRDGVLWAGGDLGERNDPTALVLSAQVGDVLRDRVRVRAKGMPYYAQCELIFALDELLGFRAFWGMDLGSAGTAVVKDLQQLDRFAAADYESRMTGYHFQQSVPCIDEDGQPLEEEGKDGDVVIVKAPAKHWATQMIVTRLQRRGYAMAYDVPVINAMTSHTAREGAKFPIYAKVDDHEIDARRQQMLRKLYNEDALSVDVFSSGAYARRAA